jgi:hypothetical protein
MLPSRYFSPGAPNHLLTPRNSFIFFNSIGHHFNIVNVYMVWIREDPIGVQSDGLLDVPEQRRMSYPYAGDCAAPDHGDGEAGNYPILTLQGQFGCARVQNTYVMAPGKEVNLRGSVSNCLLAMSGSMQASCNRMSTIDEVRVAFGRKRRQPSKLGACARSRGNS